MKYDRYKSGKNSRQTSREKRESNNEKEIVTAFTLATDGRALAKSKEGALVFIDRLLPGETAQVNVTTVKSSYKSASIHKITNEAPERVHAPCSYYAECGGCSLQHLQQEFHIDYKVQWLFETLNRIGKWKSENISEIKKRLSIVYLNQWNYRRRIRLHFDGKNLGFKKNLTHHITDISDCLIAHPLINKKIEELSSLCQEGFKFLASQNELKTIKLELELTVSDNNKCIVHIARLETEPKKIESISFTYYQKLFVIQHDERLQLGHPELGRMKIKKESFVQPHMQSIESYYFHIKSSLNKFLSNLFVKKMDIKTDNKFSALDLFCGAGVFTCIPYFLSKKYSFDIDVLGVEGIGPSVDSFKMNYKDHAVRVECEDVFSYIDKKFKKVTSGLEEPVSVVIVDPPRSGFGLEATQKLVEICDRVCFIAFLACDPATFARDSRVLIQARFKITDCFLFEAFAQTPHYELLFCFERS